MKFWNKLERTTKGKLVFWGIMVAFLASMGWVYGAAMNDKVVCVGGGNQTLLVFDEDAMGSNSAVGLATQQSVKAYVDSGAVTMTNKTLTSPTLTNPTISGGFMGGVTRHVCSGTTIQMTGAYNTWLVDRAVANLSGVTLPQITAANDGMEIMFKIVDDASATTPFNIWPYHYGYTDSTGNLIESTQGEMSGTSDIQLDADGNCRKWKANYRAASGTTSGWILILDER